MLQPLLAGPLAAHMSAVHWMDAVLTAPQPPPLQQHMVSGDSGRMRTLPLQHAINVGDTSRADEVENRKEKGARRDPNLRRDICTMFSAYIRSGKRHVTPSTLNLAPCLRPFFVPASESSLVLFQHDISLIFIHSTTFAHSGETPLSVISPSVISPSSPWPHSNTVLNRQN